MLALRDILELVNDRFGNGAFAQQHFVDPGHQAILHVGLEFGDQRQAERFQQLLNEGLGEVVFSGEDLAKQTLDKAGPGRRSSTLPGIKAKWSNSPSI